MLLFGTEAHQPHQISMCAFSKKRISPLMSREFDGFRDIHWGFSTAADSIEFAERLLEFAALEDITKLTVLGESIGRKVYKDTMVLLQK